MNERRTAIQSGNRQHKSLWPMAFAAGAGLLLSLFRGEREPYPDECIEHTEVQTSTFRQDTVSFPFASLLPLLSRECLLPPEMPRGTIHRDDEPPPLQMDRLDALFASFSDGSGAEAITAFSSRPEESYAFLTGMLNSPVLYHQYLATRIVRELRDVRFSATLDVLILDRDTAPPVRTGALYARAFMPMGAETAAQILARARDFGVSERCAALAALAWHPEAVDPDAIRPFLTDPDPVTGTYAARLLLELGAYVDIVPFLGYAHHHDYWVRQQCYALLGNWESETSVTTLEESLGREQHASAAREARLALYRLRAAGFPSAPSYWKSMLDAEDEWGQRDIAEYLLSTDTNLGIQALSHLAKANSSVAVWSSWKESLLKGNTSHVPTGIAGEAEKHYPVVHARLAADAVRLYNALEEERFIASECEEQFVRGVWDEDIGISRMHHAYNPLTGKGFLSGGCLGGPAPRYAGRLTARLRALLESAVSSAEDLLQAWHYVGRIHHLFQDMSSPLHVFSVWHMLRPCHFEVYWSDKEQEASTIAIAGHREAATPSSMPHGATRHLDAFSRQSLEERLERLPDTLEAYALALAWTTYYHASWWGTLQFDDEAGMEETPPVVFDDGQVPALPNTFYRLFDGNIRYHAGWFGDYFQITDRMGNDFVWNKCLVMDDWRPCPNPRRGTSAAGHGYFEYGENSDRILTVAGRFLFQHKGRHRPHCYPDYLPDGVAADTHLARHYGEVLFPVTLSYSVGWLRRLSETFPSLFPEKDVPEQALAL